MITITIENDGQVLNVKKGSNLLKVLNKNGYKVKSPCGGKGTCKKCKVKIRAVDSKNYEYKTVLSCNYVIDESIAVQLRDEDQFVDKKSGLIPSQRYSLDHQFNWIPLKLEKALLNKEISLVNRIEKAIGLRLEISLDMLQNIARTIGMDSFDGFLLLDGHRLLTIESEKKPVLGVAIDIGTTTMVMYLVDLEKGIVLDVVSASNPQITHGADVISRITYSSESDDHRLELQTMVVQEINRMSEQLLQTNGYTATSIVNSAICGNTTMMHMFLGLDVNHIALAPYLATYQSIDPVSVKDTKLLWNQEGQVYIMPNIAGYVGADTVSVILANRLDQSKKNILALDLGTNGEIALSVDKKIYTCSTAAGPAFEGASIEFGMRADLGAIESVRVHDGKIEVETIQNAPAIGICGSGLIDAVAKLKNAGLIDPSGKIVNEDVVPDYAAWLGKYQGQKAILLCSKHVEGAQEIWLTQKDVRELQLAKGAMLAGMNILLSRAGIQAEELDNIYLAGAFGSFIDTKSAQDINMFPVIDQNKIISVGNSAGLGAIMTLFSNKQKIRAEKISIKANYTELSSDREFNQAFTASLML